MSQAATRMRLYNSRREAGLCAECGGRRDDPGVIRCRRCREANRDSQRRTLTREARNRYMNTLYRTRKRSGNCPTCGNDRDREDRALCTRCRDRQHLQYERMKMRTTSRPVIAGKAGIQRAMPD